MITLSQVTEFFGWASVLSIGLLSVTGLLLIAARSALASLHSKMFGIPENEIAICYFNYLANFKTLIFCFYLTALHSA